MQKTFFALMLAGLLVVGAPVSADEGRPERPGFFGLFPNGEERQERADAFRNSTGTKEQMLERREEMKENIEERRAHFASTTALRRANIAENIKEHVIEHANHIARILDAMIVRLETLADRIQARIDTLEEAGVDASAAQTELDEAHVEIEEAAEAIEDVKEAVTEALAAEDPREALRAVKPLGEASKTAIREAHAALMEAVRALPGRGDESTSE